MKVDTLLPNAIAADSLRVDSMRTAAASARQITGVPLPIRPGVNRLDWDMRAQGSSGFQADLLGGEHERTRLAARRYSARLTVDSRTVTAPLTIVAIRGSPTSATPTCARNTRLSGACATRRPRPTARSSRFVA